MTNEIALITQKDLSLVSENSMNEKQLKLLLQKTPKTYVKQRPAKGGGTWDYVTGGYVEKVLNLMFGWDWDFEIIKGEVISGEAVVLGKLTVRSNGRAIVKEQYGNKDIVFKKGTNDPLSIGNDMKSAATDALKKCASKLGIAADIYNKQDFKEVHFVVEAKPELNIDEIKLLIELAEDIDQIRAITRDFPKVSLNAELMKLIAAKKESLLS